MFPPSGSGCEVRRALDGSYDAAPLLLAHSWGTWRFGEGWKIGFEIFFEDVGPKPEPSLTLDRIDNSKGYEPGNCRWATWVVQANNKRAIGSDGMRVIPKHSMWIEIGGETKPLVDWCKAPGAVRYATVFSRLKRGWPPQKAVFHPVP